MSHLTALTSLSISDAVCWKNVGGLAALPLQELILFECNHLEVDLFVPGALQSLQYLSIMDDYYSSELCLYDDRNRPPGFTREAYGQRLRLTADVIQALPCLHKGILGSCSIGHVGILGKEADPSILPCTLVFEE